MSLFKVLEEDKFVKQSEKGVSNGVAELGSYRLLKKDNLPICDGTLAVLSGYGVLAPWQYSSLSKSAEKTDEINSWIRELQEILVDCIQRKYQGQNVCAFQVEEYNLDKIYFNGKNYAKPFNKNGLCVLDLGEKKTINNTTNNEKWFVKSIRKILCLPDGITNYDNAFNPGATNKNSLEVLCDIDMSQCTSAKNMFFYQNGLKKLDVSKWDVSKLKKADCMFASTSIKELDVSKWDVSSLESCAGFITDVPSDVFDTSNWVAPNLNPAHMFVRTKATKLDISKLAMANIKSCASMFYTWGGPWFPDVSNRDKAIIGLDTLDTSKCTDFETMFSGLGNVTLDVSHFDMRAATNVTDMFGVDKAGTQDVTLGENFFDMPNITAFNLSSLSMSENLKQSLINCFDRKTAGQPTMTIQMPTRLNSGVTALTDEEKAAIEAKGYIVKYNS